MRLHYQKRDKGLEELTLKRVIAELECFAMFIKGELFIGDGVFDEVKALFEKEVDEVLNRGIK